MNMDPDPHRLKWDKLEARWCKIEDKTCKMEDINSPFWDLLSKKSFQCQKFNLLESFFYHLLCS